MGVERGFELWIGISGLPPSPPPANYTPRLPEADDAEDEAGDTDGPPEWVGQTITGRALILHYEDSRRQVSERLVVCRRLAEQAGVLYLDAFCHARKAPRRFRADRVRAVVDHETGEVHEPGFDFLCLFAPNMTTDAPHRYGLSPQHYADFNAALNVLAFLARCDGRWHPLEGDAIIDFAERYWLRAGITAPFDADAVLRHGARLAPDPESFWVSFRRCCESAVLAPIIRDHASAVVHADGQLHELEIHWGRMMDAFSHL